MKKVTIKDVANQLNVSTSLVSKALNGYKDVSDEKRAFIIDEAKKMGYYPDENAANLARKNNVKIALLMSANDDDQFIDELCMTYTMYSFRKINELGFEPIVIYFDFVQKMTPSELLHYFISKGVVAVVIFGYSGKNNLEELMNYSKIKKVLIDEEFTNESTTSISSNNYEAQYEITNLFCNNETTQKILYLTGDLITYVGNERYKGFNKFVKKHKDKEIDIQVCNFDVQIAYNTVINSSIQYDAIVCASDMMAVLVSKACFINGYSPLIIGFDGIKLINYSNLKIATVKQDFKGMARRAVSEAIELVNGKESKNIIIKHKIIESE